MGIVNTRFLIVQIFWGIVSRARNEQVHGAKCTQFVALRVANPAKDLIVAFAEDDSSILTIDSSNAWRVVITP